MGILDLILGKSSTIKKITSKEAKANLDNDKSIVLLDVREGFEYKNGHIPKAINISVNNISSTIENKVKNKYTTLYVYCLSGARSKAACLTLSKLGYTNVYNLGRIGSWPYDIKKITGC